MVHICTASMVGHCWWQLPKIVTQIFCPLHLTMWRGHDHFSWLIFGSMWCHKRGILIISNRYAAIKVALNAESSGRHPPLAHYAYCIRHIVSNFVVTFKSKDAKRILMNEACTKTHREYLYYHSWLRDENLAMCEWIDRIFIEKWA